MGKGGTTIGYHYLLTLVMNLCRGPIDELVEIEVGGETAWRGGAATSTPQVINRPDLFGGETREGGIQGAFRLFQGAANQVLPGDTTVTVGSSGPVQSTVLRDIKALIGVPMGEMRGYASLLYDGLVSSMSPYPKEWKMRMRRHSAGWYGGTPWYGAKARVLLSGDGNYSTVANAALQGTTPSDPINLFSGVESGGISSPFTTIAEIVDDIQTTVTQVDPQIYAMNPAHIIYQCMTDPLWGAGQPTSELDENSFILAANQLCSEGFGLCFNWTRQEDVDSFIQIVIDHIGGAIYNDRATGKYVLRLIRDDYDIDDLPIYTFATGLLRIEEEDNASDVEGINEVVVKGHDPVSNKPYQVRARNPAARESSGEIISQTNDYKGAPTRALGLRLAQRDLRAYSAGLKRYRVVLDRRAWKVAPSSVIRIQAPERGLADIVIRVGEVDYGDRKKREISCRAIEDIFAMPSSSFSAVVSGSYSGSVAHPLPSPKRDLVEANYRDIYRRIGATEAGNLADTSATVLQLALAPTGASVSYDLTTKAVGEANWRQTTNQAFTAFAALAADLSAAATTATIETNFGISSEFIGKALLIGGPGGEVVRLDSIAGPVLTIARGCADTVPRAHLDGASVWALDDTPGSDAREYAVGETVHSQVLTRTSSAVLAPDTAPVDAVTLAGRHALPFPPAQAKVDGVSVLALSGVYDEPVLTWVARNRLTQADQLIAFSEASVAAEAGTTYRIRVYDPLNLTTPLRTVTGIAGLTWTYTTAMQLVDGLPEVVFRLGAARGGLTSWQEHQFLVRVNSGYGFGYGNDYGGA